MPNEIAQILKNDLEFSSSWIMDILKCVNKLPAEFTINDIYFFEAELHKKHPNNNNVKAKIRQQLQILRDNGLLIFLGNGRYRKEL